MLTISQRSHLSGASDDDQDDDVVSPPLLANLRCDFI